MWPPMMRMRIPPQRGPEDQSKGEITEGEADPADSGLPTLEQLKTTTSQPPDNANVSQARPQAIAKAQSIKSSSSDQRSV